MPGHPEPLISAPSGAQAERTLPLFGGLFSAPLILGLTAWGLFLHGASRACL